MKTGYTSIDKKYNFTYKTINNINGKYYLGCHSSDEPWNDNYLGSGVALKDAIYKYGAENFEMEWLDTFDTRKEMLEAERSLITEEVIKDKNCYNMITGGFGNTKYSDEVKARMSLAQMGNKKSLGNIHSKETRLKMSKKAKGRVISQKQREDIRRTLTGRKATEQRKVNQRIGLSKGLYVTPYGTFHSTGDAAEMLGTNRQTITRACITNNHKKFTAYSAYNGSGIFSIYEKKIGQTYKEIGFGFIKMTEEIRSKLLTEKGLQNA